jgi:16S rRNA (cytidine1402-2'-O)-methyltransferase
VPGKLLVIATPIGNLGDLSPRAADAIRSCDLLLCEDTRQTRKLLSHLGASVPMESFHEHSEEEKLERIIGLLERGNTVGLVSDAGTPLLSDPGFPLVRAARRAGVTVEPIPGPFAGVTALSASGLPPVPFCFLGFLPRRSSERKDLFRKLPRLAMTTVVFESPHRVRRSLEDLREELGDVRVAVGRELTKIHEEILEGSVSEILETLSERDRIRGELTLVIAPIEETGAATDLGPEQLREEFERLRSEGMRRPDAVKLLADRHGISRRDLYDRLKGEQ